MKLSKRTRQIIFIFVSSFCGAFLLSLLATFQKKALGAPIVTKGYFVPFIFGGASGGTIGFYIMRINGLNSLLQERINNLEGLLPICANCKRIRKPDSDPKNLDSWQQIESYISQRTSSKFSHSICPECMKKLYGNIDDEK